MTAPAREVRFERTYAAPIEVVFDAWTSPEVMRRWLHPASDWGTPEAEVDLRTGGREVLPQTRPQIRTAHCTVEKPLVP